MRQTVEEKLEQTLQNRLKASFETVSKQLESVNQGLGEMKKCRTRCWYLKQSAFKY